MGGGGGGGGGEARHFNQRTSYVTNMQLLSIKHHKRRINTLFTVADTENSKGGVVKLGVTIT